jgi:hypothetical protein
MEERESEALGRYIMKQEEDHLVKRLEIAIMLRKERKLTRCVREKEALRQRLKIEEANNWVERRNFAGRLVRLYVFEEKRQLRVQVRCSESLCQHSGRYTTE